MGSEWMRRLSGDLFLGYRAVVAHPLRRLLDRDERTGKERFLANYAPEGLVPTPLRERELLRGAARCIHCGLCDGVYSQLSGAARAVNDGPSLLALQYSRSAPDLIHARQALESLDERALERGEAVCPTRVPLRSLVQHLRTKLLEVETARSIRPEQE